MNIHATRNLIAILPLALGLGACAGTNLDTAERQVTHYWYAQEARTDREYNLDQTRCSEAHEVPAAEPMVKDSLSFASYRDCMLAKGYVLRNY